MLFFKNQTILLKISQESKQKATTTFFFLLIQFYIWGETGSSPDWLASRTWLVQHKISDFNHSAMISQGSHHKKLFCGIHFGKKIYKQCMV